ncbi:MAG: type III pantothenate kinase [Ignavibacteria bacterium]|jgi:type III pantothenate kinase|nr:type III pantothenate kinase [Ignavibacteria bacterium]
MNKLIIDIGNTYIKGCYGNGTIYGVQRSVYSKREFKKYFNSFIEKFRKKPESVFVVTQNTYLIPHLKKIICSAYGNVRVGIPKIDFKSPLKVSYSKTLGNDRYFAAAGAFFKFNTYRNIIVIDMGTATTFNLISDGVFRGGMISPGITTAARILSDITTLPEIKLKKGINPVNSDTINAINSGILLQQKYFIEKCVVSYRKIYKGLLTVITGGGYRYLLNNIEGIDVYEKNIVLEGINFIINRKYAETK